MRMHSTNDANSLLQSLQGLSWSQWPTFKTDEEDDNDNDFDVMRLQSADMAIFGLCPIEDDLVLVTCDICGLIVKLEAFEQHLFNVHHEPRASKNCGVVAKTKKNFDFVQSPRTSLKTESPPLLKASSSLQSSSLHTSALMQPTISLPNVLSIKETDALPRAVRAMVSAGEALMLANDNNVDTSPDNNSLHSQCSTPTLTSKSVLLSTPPTPSSRTLSPVSSKKLKAGGKLGSVREYNPDTNCGVMDNDRRCTRALTCKSHSIALKRKVENRSKPFDILVAEYKASKAEAEANKKNNNVVTSTANTASSTLTPPLNINATVESVLSSISADGPLAPKDATSGIRPLVVGMASRKRPYEEMQQQQQVLLPSTQSHPKPLALARFCSRRVGGILVANRAHLVPRKLLRVSIAAGGFQRLRPTKQPNSTLNKPVLITPKGIVLTKSTNSPQVITLGNNGVFNGLVNSNSNMGDQPCFKTEIADFKGGIKFEMATPQIAATPTNNSKNKIEFLPGKWNT